jgi:hypothetical protein
MDEIHIFLLLTAKGGVNPYDAAGGKGNDPRTYAEANAKGKNSPYDAAGGVNKGLGGVNNPEYLQGSNNKGVSPYDAAGGNKGLGGLNNPEYLQGEYIIYFIS